ncbi:beta-galactosidase-like [Chelonus insularis]|uniref:beta-galactosidase-like n=1 Tax=Chelonus insularis TaxID=460826 RepID=UPI00158C14F5|nr:beta-galactosidase-like [Chelonus insularis]
MCKISLKSVIYSSFIIIEVLSVILHCEAYVNGTQLDPVDGFEVDYENNQFLLDGKPFRYVSGSFHYFRTPRAFWRDRLRKIRAAGLNAISTYVEWSLHEPSPGNWRWTGEADLVAFLTMAKEEDLLVLLRPGPYIDAERDLGGLPFWLMTLHPDIKLRTNDEQYMRYVRIYLDEVLKRVKHLLRGNGGPIIMIQVENEYGSFNVCDKTYTESLRNIINEHVESKAVLYTTDGWKKNLLECGVISGVFATVDFGIFDDIFRAFNSLRKFQEKGPLVVSEFYSGWLTHWDETFQVIPTKRFIHSLIQILSLNASVNIYMFYGGTNFGFTSGADGDERFRPVITSYDYDAPLTEAGDPTDKYFAIRKTLAEFLPLPDLPLPTVAPKGDYGSVLLEPVMELLNNPARNLFANTAGQFDVPPTFEKLNFVNGLVLYESNFPPRIKDPTIIHADVADRGIVYVDNYLVGTLSRTLKINSVVSQNPYAKKLAILVENQGHLNYGNLIEDWKGIFNVHVDGKVIPKWNVTSYSLGEMISLRNFSTIKMDPGNLVNGPVLLRGTFTIKNDPLDTYLNTADWGKGIAYVNGHNLGRYWPQTGPQITLYVPSAFLMTGVNELVILELEYIPNKIKMKLQNTPNLGVPSVYEYNEFF